MTGTFILNTILFVAVASFAVAHPKRKLVPVAVLFLAVELTFFSSNIAKIEHGAWLPLAVGADPVARDDQLATRPGHVTRNRVAKEGALEDFLATLPTQQPTLLRVPGVAVFLNPSKETTPLALRAEVEHDHTLHERILVVSVETVSVPTSTNTTSSLSRSSDMRRLTSRTSRSASATRTPSTCRRHSASAANTVCSNATCDLEHASYFLSRITITPTNVSGLSSWRQKLFIAMARNAASPVAHFGLPSDQTVSSGRRSRSRPVGMGA